MILVTYNSAHIVEDAVGPLLGLDWVEVICIDNASSDRTVDCLKRLGTVRLLENTENVGFARAVNLAASAAKGSYLLLLNPDARLTTDALEGLVETMEGDREIGIAAPILEDNEGSSRTHVLNGGMAPTAIRMMLHASGMSRLGEVFPSTRGFQYLSCYHLRDVQEVDWVSGACMLIRGELWDRLGGLSERWFMYAEDVELCLRVARSGYRIVFCPQSQGYHATGGSTRGEDGKLRIDWILNLYSLYVEWYEAGWLRKRLWKGAVLFGFVLRLLVLQVGISEDRGSTSWAGEIRRYRAYVTALRSVR